MIYTDYKGESLSRLAFGTMRLPLNGDDSSDIDAATTGKMVEYAFDHGINYFDTAWGYHGGNSELVVGEALKGHDRKSFNLATKFPGYDVSNFGKHEEIFAKQLEKCQVDYFDFYLIHNVCEMNIEQYLDEDKYHTVSYFVQQRAEGKIRHLGFSTHGTYDTFMRFIDKYGDQMEFCQIQLNYLDWSFQDAKRKVEYCNDHGIKVWVMEPLRGGYLCKIDDEHMAKLEALRPGVSAVEWAFRWLQTVVPEGVILGGMSTPEQMEQNIGMFAEPKPLNDAELAALADIAADMTAKIGLPCTACRYCVPHCPMELDIPNLLSLYNEYRSKEVKDGFIAPMAIAVMPEDKRPGNCIACGACESVCPQALSIPDALAELAENFEKK